MQPVQVKVRPNEVIAHDDKSALCTKEGIKRWEKVRRFLLKTNDPITSAIMLRSMYGEYEYEDNRQSGRLANTSKSDLEKMK